MFKKITKTIILGVFIFSFSVSSANYTSVRSLTLVDKNIDVGDLGSSAGSISSDGSYVVFISESTNLIAGDTNDLSDVFLYEVSTGNIERINEGPLGEEADVGTIWQPVISGDGRYIAFLSEATNLVAGDINAKADIFTYDTQEDEMLLISNDFNGGPSNDDSFFATISEDGRYISYGSSATDLVEDDTNVLADVFVWDRTTGENTRVSVADDESEITDSFVSRSSISPTGRYVVFESASNELVSGDTNGQTDVFLRDTVLGTTERISLDSNENEIDDFISVINLHNPMISEDGRYVVFWTEGAFVPEDTNDAGDVYLRDRTLGTTERVSVSTTGTQASSGNGLGAISSDGRYVTFGSSSSDLVPNDTTSGDGTGDIFIRDLFYDVTSRINISEAGLESDGGSDDAGFLTSGGRFIVYGSNSTNLTEDSDGLYHVYLAEIMDTDEISSAVEDAAPNSGDIDENGYDDAIEYNVSSFVNPVSSAYTTVKTTGDCVANSNLSASVESSLGTQDSGYDYPLGIISFEVECKEAGETATVSVFCFCENTPVEGTIVRKYNDTTGEYTTIESAVVEEVTIDGQRALKMTYDVVDGGSLDEDGLEDGTIIDPVGFARTAAVVSSGGGSSSSGSRPRTNLIAQIPTTVQNTSDDVCVKSSFTTLMKKGSKFGEVSKLQEVLNALKFNSGVADGLFGPVTDMAVKAFQTANSLDSDGIVGPITRGVLNLKCL
jgi:hypothetical protein